MKIIKLLFLLVALMAINKAQAQDANDVPVITAEAESVAPGETTNLVVSLDHGEKTVTGFQLDVTLPQGFSISDDDDDDVCVLAKRCKGLTITYRKMAEDRYRFIAYSLDMAPIKGSSGPIVTISFVANDNIGAGNYEGLVSNVILSTNDPNVNGYYPSDATFNIVVVGGYLMGDVNGDSKINGSDIVEMVDRIMERQSDKFVEEAADLNGDGKINGSDLTLEIELVMSQGVSAPASAASLRDGLDICNHPDGTMSVSMNDSRRFIMAQMVVELSPNLSLEEITTDKLHQVAYKRLSGNRYMVVCYSNSNAAFSSNDNIITFRHSGEGDINITNAMLVDENRTESHFNTVFVGEATGISTIGTDTAKTYDILSLDGVLVRKQSTSLEGLQKGIYIINGKKVIVK